MIYAFLTGGLTALGFVGTINAQQAQEITKAVKTLVQDYLCKSDQVTIESVTYNRNTGYLSFYNFYKSGLSGYIFHLLLKGQLPFILAFNMVNGNANLSFSVLRRRAV